MQIPLYIYTCICTHYVHFTTVSNATELFHDSFLLFYHNLIIHFSLFSRTPTLTHFQAHTHIVHTHTRWQLYSMKCEKNQRYRSNIKIIVQSQKKSNKKEKKRLPQTTQCTLHMCECFCAFIQRKTTTIRRYSRLH